MEKMVGKIMRRYRQIETWIECSAATSVQIRCFHGPLQHAEIKAVQKVVEEKLPEGVDDKGLTLDAFLVLHALFITKGRCETTWAVLREFGYEDDLQLRKDFAPIPFKKVAPDQNVELTTEAVEFLREKFRSHDTGKDGALQPNEIDNLFATAPESSDEYSWQRSKELLAEVASKGDENEDYRVPCLLIAVKGDLDPDPMTVQHSLGVSKELGIEAPIQRSMKEQNLNVFGRIAYAAEHPHLSIPETETRKNSRKYRQFNRSLTLVSVGAAAVVGLALYRNYAARKSASA